MSKELAVSGNYKPDTLESQKEFLQALIDSRQIPCKNINEAYTIACYGKELGFSTITSFNFIVNIQGKLSLSVKAMKALLLRGGVSWKTIYDGAYLYKDGSIEEFKVDKGESNKVTDMITRIEFRRTVNGKEMVEFGSFTYREAETATLVKPGGNWTKYPRQMLYARAFSNGADKIATDLLLGFYSADEIASVVGVDESRIKRNADGEVEAVIDAECTVEE